MAHQTNSNDTCPRIFRNANRRPWVSNVHDEWGCIINKIHGGKYLWGKNTETSTFQNHLDHKLAILRLSQTSFFISPDDLPTMRIIPITCLFLQYPWTLCHTSLQSCRLWNCKTQLQQPRHQLMLCKDPFKLVKVDVYVYECLGAKAERNAMSMKDSSQLSPFRDNGRKVQENQVQGHDWWSSRCVTYWQKSYRLCYVYRERFASFCVRHPTHGERFKRCQCQMMFWPHASSLQMQADARCWCATCPLYQKINTYHLNSAELVNSASRKPVPHCLMTHWLQHAVVFECQRRDICSMLFKNICTMFTDWKNYMQSKNTCLYTIVIYIHMYIHRAF